MNSKILLLAVTVAVLSSCTTSYKTGQTPDDVYYSPVRPQDEYVQRERKEDDRRYRNSADDYYDDQYLRMKVRDRYRWSVLDDPYYNRYNYYSSYNCGCFGNPWTPATYWNNYYNPYYLGTVIVNPKTTTTYSGPRQFNLNSYNNTALTNGNYSNPKFNPSGNNSTYNNNTYNSPRNSNSNNSNSGNILRDIFGGNSNSSKTNNNNSSSTSTPSSSGSSSGSSGSSAPVRKFN